MLIHTPTPLNVYSVLFKVLNLDKTASWVFKEWSPQLPEVLITHTVLVQMDIGVTKDSPFPHSPHLQRNA